MTRKIQQVGNYVSESCFRPGPTDMLLVSREADLVNLLGIHPKGGELCKIVQWSFEQNDTPFQEIRQRLRGFGAACGFGDLFWWGPVLRRS